MTTTRYDKLNNILYKIAKPILLIVGLIWIPIKLYETDFTFLQSSFQFFTLVGNVIFGTFFVSIISSMVLDKGKTKDKMIQVIITVLGLNWGLHIYTLFSENKHMPNMIATAMNWIAFIIGIAAVLFLSGFTVYYFVVKRFRN